MSQSNYSLTIRANIPAQVGMLGKVMAAIGDAGGQVGGVDIVRSSRDTITRDITVYARDDAHGEAIGAVLGAVPGVAIDSLTDRVFLAHAGGKIGMENRDVFLAAGGEKYDYVPALNGRADHVAALHAVVKGEACSG